MNTMTKETTNIYADNEKLYPILCAWKKQIAETGDRKMPNELGAAIMDIANGLSRRYNFNRYSEDWKMDMIDDGISAAISGLHNFDETRYTNVYGYINKACWQAFVTRILYEKKRTRRNINSSLSTFTTAKIQIWLVLQRRRRFHSRST
ncbi:sigma factor for late transcription [Klebsiella phage CPRSB]|nr:sigma factor for late transcription [Klebsiella phage CPRSB]